MVRWRRNPRAGFSLTEAMMVVAVVSILASLGSRLILQANRYFILTKTRAELQRESRAVMYVISRALHQAQSETISITRASSSQPFCTDLTFDKIQGDTLRFRQVGRDLIQTTNGSSVTLSKNVRYLAFTFPRTDDQTIMSVSFTLEKDIYEGRTKALHMASERVRVMN